MNLGALYVDQGKYKDALPLYEKALELYIDIYGQNHSTTATSYNNLAFLYQSLGNYNDAETFNLVKSIAKEYSDAGADIFVSGSGILNTPDYNKTISEMKNIIK